MGVNSGAHRRKRLLIVRVQLISMVGMKLSGSNIFEIAVNGANEVPQAVCRCGVSQREKHDKHFSLDNTNSYTRTRVPAVVVQLDLSGARRIFSSVDIPSR